jgi:hypothetical protein
MDPASYPRAEGSAPAPTEHPGGLPVVIRAGWSSPARSRTPGATRRWRSARRRQAPCQEVERSHRPHVHAAVNIDGSLLVPYAPTWAQHFYGLAICLFIVLLFLGLARPSSSGGWFSRSAGTALYIRSSSRSGDSSSCLGLRSRTCSWPRDLVGLDCIPGRCRSAGRPPTTGNGIRFPPSALWPTATTRRGDRRGVALRLADRVDRDAQ